MFRVANCLTSRLTPAEARASETLEGVVAIDFAVSAIATDSEAARGSEASSTSRTSDV